MNFKYLLIIVSLLFNSTLSLNYKSTIKALQNQFKQYFSNYVKEFYKYYDGFFILINEFKKLAYDDEYSYSQNEIVDNSGIKRFTQMTNFSSDDIIDNCQLGKTLPYNNSTVCICPVTSEDCVTITKDVVCKINELYSDNNNLLRNKDTFYYEYFKRTNLEYNETLKLSVKLKCHNRYPLNNTKLTNFFILRNYEEEGNYDTYSINNTSEKYFDYYLDEDNITLYNKPDLSSFFKVYEMNQIMPFLTIEKKLPDDEIIDIILGKKK